MLAATALVRLQQGLSSALAAMGIATESYGQVHLVESASKESEVLFQGYAKRRPSKEDAYAAALAFLRGASLHPMQQDLIASALSEPIREQGGKRVLGDSRFTALLALYEAEALAGELWRLTWHGLLSSYFAFDAVRASAAEKSGWEALRRMLERTWPFIDRDSGSAIVPDWVRVMRAEHAVLSLHPADKYGRDYLAGNTAAVQQLSSDLGITSSSWFWHALVLGAVNSAIGGSSEMFRSLIPRMIQLVEEHPVHRDDAIEKILVRYRACVNAPQDDRLRDYVVRKDVWKNPKLLTVGMATAWSRIPTDVWRMVLNWVNERNLKDFFDILARRNSVDDDRLTFWSQYMHQIDATRLVFGARTMELKNSHPGIRDLIAREEGAYATLAGKEVDAFIMEIGNYLIVEFSIKGNAAYAYALQSLRFDRHGTSFKGTKEDLKYGYDEYGKGDGTVLRFLHKEGWQHDAADQLRRHGIRPDRELPASHPAAPKPGTAAPVAVTRSAGSVTQPEASNGAPLSMERLTLLVGRFDKAKIVDSRSKSGGRLWVEDPAQRTALASQLEKWGFRWSNARMAWWHPES